VGRSVISFTIKNIDAREKLKREIEPLLARNKNKNGDKAITELPRSSSAEHHANINDPINNIEESKFTVMPGNRPAREAGKSVNPMSRGQAARLGDAPYYEEHGAFN
jgi:hypothetical protein